MNNQVKKEKSITIGLLRFLISIVIHTALMKTVSLPGLRLAQVIFAPLSLAPSSLSTLISDSNLDSIYKPTPLHYQTFPIAQDAAFSWAAKIPPSACSQSHLIVVLSIETVIPTAFSCGSHSKTILTSSR